MKSLRFASILVIFYFLVSTVTAIGVYNSAGDYIFYTNKVDPTINISVRSISEPLFPQYANLTINETIYNSGNVNPSQVSNEEIHYIFKFSDFGPSIPSSLTENLDISFLFYIEDGAGEQFTGSINSDPLDFSFIYDITPPENTTQIDSSYLIDSNNRNLSFSFNEKIADYTLSINSQEITTESFSYLTYAEYTSSFEVEIPSEVQEGTRTAELKVKDLAGNEETFTFDLVVRGPPVEIIKLHTLQDDSSLNYYTNKDEKEFFQGRIYAKQRDITLKLETSKPSTCFYDVILNFAPLPVSPSSSSEFSSSDDLIHTKDITLPSSVSQVGARIACRSNEVPDDITYLYEYFDVSQSLTQIILYSGADLEITSATPKNLVTYTPFDISLTTNEKALCTFSISGDAPQDLTTTSFTQHKAEDISRDNGQYTMEYSCRDAVYNEDTLTQPLEIDTTRGAIVTSYSPKYFTRMPANIKLTLSEIPESCKYALNKKSELPAAEYDQLSSVSESNGIYSITNGNLIQGENEIFVYCLRETQEIFESKLTLLYDSNGIKISNFTFTKNSNPVEYVGSQKELSFEFEVDSLIPVTSYDITVVRGTQIITTKTITKESATLYGNFTGATAIKIKAKNVEESIESQEFSFPIQFDLVKPSVSISSQGSLKTVVCVDEQSGCDKVYYGLDKTPLTCKPNVKYNSSVDPTGYEYICAKGIDKAGNEQIITQAVTINFSSSGGGGSSGGNTSNQTPTLPPETETNETDGNGTQDDPFEDDPFDPFEDTPEGDDDSSLLLIVAAVLIFLGLVGGGGYYAYSKGYLDDQLKKYGIAPARGNSKNTSQGASNLLGNGPNKQGRTAPETSKKSSYDSHLKKLKGFLNETLDKRKDVFDSFKGPDKGKVDGYEDTLIKGSKVTESQKDAEFDEFYKSSTGNKIPTQHSEDEAKKFEEYHKEKKETNKKNSKK